MSKIQFTPNASGTGTFNIVSPNSNSDFTLTLPESSGTILFQEGTIPFDAGSVSTPSITTTGDLNTGIWFPAADTMAASTGGTERMRIDSSGNVGIGTSAPSNVLTVLSATQYKGYTLKNATNTVAELIGFATGNDTGGLKLYSAGVAQAQILAGGTSYFNGGNVGIGTTSPATGALMQVGDGTDAISMTGTDPIFAVKGASFGTGLVVKRDGYAEAGIQSSNTGTFGTFTNHPVMFKINNAEAMRIETDGQLLINTTSNALTGKLQVHFDGSALQGITIKNTVNNASGAAVRFVDYTGAYSGGGIYYQSSNSINYASSSDYRLKENVVATTGAVEKVKQLNPVNFNFIGASESVDGFLAHELQTVVPNSVIGEKDAVTNSGENKYQVADYAKLIPLLTAALKETVEKIETLEARVASLEAN